MFHNDGFQLTPTTKKKEQRSRSMSKVAQNSRTPHSSRMYNFNSKIGPASFPSSALRVS